jgi:hypothetical protein
VKEKNQYLKTIKIITMKKLSMIAIAVMLSAGAIFSSNIQAQTKSVNLENFDAITNVAKNPGSITETPIYNKKGKLLYSVRRYDETGLPKDIDRLVRNQYVDFDIIGVEEVVIPSGSNSIYFVHIANDKKLETVKVYNGESEIVNEYKKG